MIKKDRNGTELQYAQICGRAGSPRRKAGGKIISALALVVMLVLLSACGKGGDMETPTEEPASAGETESFSTEEDSSDAITIDDSAFATTIIEPAPESEPKEEVVVEKTEKEEKEKEEPFSAKGKNLTIVLDPGHSSQVPAGTEPIGPDATETKVKDTVGVLGKSSSTYEYDLTMNVCKKLRAELEDRGYKVVLTHADTTFPMSQSERAKVANENKADAFIRVFANSSDDTTVHGASAVCITKNNPYHPELFSSSFRLSDVILNTFCDKTGAKLERIWMSDGMTGNNWSEVPCTLIRRGYMSNPDEDLQMNMDSYRLEMASAIADGVDRWFATMPAEEKSMHKSFNTGADGNESAAISGTGQKAEDEKAYSPEDSTTPSSTKPGNDPESPVDTVPATGATVDDTLAPDAGLLPDGTLPQGGTVPAGTGTPAGTTTTPAPNINNWAETTAPSNTTNNTNNTNKQTMPPVSPAPGSDGDIHESDYLYFNNDVDQPTYWNDGSDSDKENIDFQTGEDDTSYPGGDLAD